ncbi:DNA adenine methylase [Neomoorella thermoacetica]|uniref:DNA adenine methylase n=1 Tax=Neomoorella thermoacetica TaxID=1525 RepID=UPI0030D011BE
MSVPSPVRPFLKWAGGKGQLLEQLQPLLPQNYSRYLEPMVGGGALFFYLQPAYAILADLNDELINVYRVVRDNVEELIADLRRHRNTREYYYAIRDTDPARLPPVARASRFIYLNRTCYNGLYRVNRLNKFNVPFGRYKNPDIVNAAGLRAASGALQAADLRAGDFSLVLEYARPGDFIYFDPPYQPLNRTSRFTSYTAGNFGEGEQKRLARVFRELTRRGCLVMLSNSDTPLIRELYRDFRIETVHARRAINSRPDRRGSITELVILNY